MLESVWRDAVWEHQLRQKVVRKLEEVVLYDESSVSLLTLVDGV